MVCDIGKTGMRTSKLATKGIVVNTKKTRPAFRGNFTVSEGKLSGLNVIIGVPPYPGFPLLP